MKLEKDEVEHIAKLSRIELNEEEKEKFARDLGEIINYVTELDSAPTENITEIAQISDLENIDREDIIAESLSNEQALKNASEGEDGFIKVKKVFE